MEIAALVVGPKRFPQPQYISPLKLSLIPHQEHAEEEKEICRVGRLEMQVQLRIHELDKVVECCELLAHTRLVPQEVSLLFTC